MLTNTGPGAANPGASTDASTNPVPIVEVDPKQPWSPLGQAASSPPGWYPLGIEGAGSEPEDFQADADDELSLPQSAHSPRMPAPGSRLIDQPPAARGFGIMSGR